MIYLTKLKFISKTSLRKSQKYKLLKKLKKPHLLFQLIFLTNKKSIEYVGYSGERVVKL